MKQQNLPGWLKSTGYGLFTVFMFSTAFAFIFPFILLFLTSFKKAEEIFGPFITPDCTYLENYRLVFSTPSFYQSLLNSVLLCVVTMTFAVVLSAMAGYMVTRADEKIFKITYFIFIFTLIIPGQSNMVVLYKLGAWMHLINTVPYLIL